MWLSANQMAVLFDRDAKTVRKHINNVFEEKEVPQDNNTHFLRVDGVKQPVAYYSLDVIISVGYRVKSKRGTDFRIWARKVLKQYLIKGFAVNDRIRQEQIGELRQLVQVVGRAITNQEVPDTIESQDLLNVVVDYTYALDTQVLATLNSRTAGSAAHSPEIDDKDTTRVFGAKRADEFSHRSTSWLLPL